MVGSVAVGGRLVDLLEADAMIRKNFPLRPNWVERCNEVGFDFCNLPSSDGSWYWSEGVAYELTLRQVDHLDDSTHELHAMCMAAVADMVRSGDYHPAYGFDEGTKSLIQTSWNRGDKHLYGRFDLAYDGQSIKMLEYNADTPTSLLEASVVQWNWLEEAEGVPNRDQFNGIHEKLIERWKIVGGSLAVSPRIHFVGHEDAGREDWGNLEYLMDTAFQAGIDVTDLSTASVGWDGKGFVDLDGKSIVGCFKLYPWEHMMADQFGINVTNASTRWIEPPWKMLLSNKALLPILWQRHKGHPFLLPAFFDDGNLPSSGKWVRKPTLAREGANVTMIEGGQQVQLSGSDFNPEYDKSGYVIQEWVDLPYIAGFRPIIGSWVIGDQAAGIGIREDYNVVTGNDSHFVPHYFVE